MSRIITVKGTGKASAKPDLIVISITLKAKDLDYEKTASMAARDIESLRQTLKNAGFSRKDLKTASFNIEPHFENVKDKKGEYRSEFAGYVCSHSLSLEFDYDMKHLSKVLSALASCPSRPEFSVDFTLKDKEAFGNQLLASATANAREKAELLAKAAGVAIGDILSIDYSWSDVHYMSSTNYMRNSSFVLNSLSSFKSMDIEPEDIKSSDTVSIVWEIK